MVHDNGRECRCATGCDLGRKLLGLAFDVPPSRIPADRMEREVVVMRMSCVFAPSLESHEHARIAESLGYDRAFFYDSPAFYADVWVQLSRSAERTSRIVLGPGVITPSLRHPMTQYR
jgi:hypothetical protein